MKKFALVCLLGSSFLSAHDTAPKILEKTVATGPLCYTLPEFSPEVFECSYAQYSTGMRGLCVYQYQYLANQKFKTIIAEAGKPVYELDHLGSEANTVDFKREGSYTLGIDEALTSARKVLSHAIRSFMATKAPFACKE